MKALLSTLALAGALAALAAAPLRAAPTSEGPFAASRPVAQTADREELAAVEFDRDVCRVTRDGFPDVRITGPDGRQIPFLIQRFTRVGSQWTDSAEPARRVADLVPDPAANRLEIVVEPPRREPPAWIELVTPARDFEKRVSVYLPGPGDTWRPLTENQVVYDYSRFMDVRRCRITLPEAPAAERYRLVVDEVSDVAASAFVALATRTGGGQPDEETTRKILHLRDLRIDRILFGYRTRQDRPDAPVYADYPLHITAVENDPREGVTRLLIAAERLPVAELRFHIADRNVSRPVRVEVRRSLDDGTVQWQRVGEGVLRLLDFRDVREESLSVPLAQEVRATELRVVISNRDAAPLTVQGVTAVCPVYRALFLAAPGVRYTLSYGSRDTPPARFDTEVLQRLYEEKGREVRTLALTPPGEPAEPPAPGPVERALNSRALLLIVLAVAVLVLGAATWSAARRIARDSTPAGNP